MAISVTIKDSDSTEWDHLINWLEGDVDILEDQVFEDRAGRLLFGIGQGEYFFIIEPNGNIDVDILEDIQDFIVKKVDADISILVTRER